MKFSHYNTLFEHDAAGLAFNARTGVLLDLPEGLFRELRRATEEDDPTQLRDYLVFLMLEFGFLIEDDYDELFAIRKELFESRFNHSAISVTIAPTLDCNLRCFYCYEIPHRKSLIMNQEVQDALLRHVSSLLQKNSVVNLYWYGGEPLMEPQIVLSMSRRMKDMCDRSESLLALSLVTNGTLLTQSLVSELSDLGGVRLQVTIDGPKEVHDRRKGSTSGEDSSPFNLVVHNLRSIDFGNFHVSIRCNLDKSNAVHSNRMLGDISDLAAKGMSIYPAPVFHPLGLNCPQASGQCYGRHDFAPVSSAFNQQACNLGFVVGRSLIPRRHYCSADSAYSIICAPDGELYKCWHHIGDHALSIGNILFGLRMTARFQEWIYFDPTREAQCSSCKALPLCLGGCPNVAGPAKRVCEFPDGDVSGLISERLLLARG